MRKWLLIFGEIVVMIWLIVSVDYIGYLWAWLPFILYNALFINDIAEMFPIEWFAD